MKRVTHELLIRDEGLSSQRVTIRSRVCKPGNHPSILGDHLYQETVLPRAPTDSTVSDYLFSMIRYHERALADIIGKEWVNYED